MRKRSNSLKKERFLIAWVIPPKRLRNLTTLTMACAFADRIAAAAPMITGTTDHQIEDCHPKRPLPLVLIAGTKDHNQTHDGWLYAFGRQTSVSETLEYWRRLNGCTGQEAKRLSHLNKDDHTRVDVVNWAGCQKGAEIRFYHVEDGGPQIRGLLIQHRQKTRNGSAIAIAILNRPRRYGASSNNICFRGLKGLPLRPFL